MNDAVQQALADRYHDLERYLRFKYKIHDPELLEELMFLTTAKVLRLQDSWDPAKSSAWSWMVLILRGFACQKLTRANQKRSTEEARVDGVWARGHWEVEGLSLDPLTLMLQAEEELLFEERVERARQLKEMRRTASIRKRGDDPPRR